MLIDPLMVDADCVLSCQPPRDLHQAPIQADLFINQFPCLHLNTRLRMVSAAKCIFMSLVRYIASLSCITLQFPAYYCFMPLYYPCDPRLCVTCFQQGINLVSLFLGKLFVAHKRSFDLAVFRGLSSFSLTLATFKVAFIS